MGEARWLAERRGAAAAGACAMIDIEAAYYVDTDLLEVSAPPTPRRRLLAVLRATHAVVRMRSLLRRRMMLLRLRTSQAIVWRRCGPIFLACGWWRCRCRRRRSAGRPAQRSAQGDA